MSAFVVLGLALSLLAVAFVLYPIVRPNRVREERRSAAAESAERRFALYRQIVEIEFDERVGKIAPSDATALTATLLEEAAGLLATQSGTEGERDREIEREIAAVRRALSVARATPVEAARR